MADPNAQANLPAAQVNFALFPATAHGNVILDYTTREGREIFKSNTRGLFAGDYLFDLEPDGIYDFISAIKRRAVQADWVAALSVPVDNADPTGDSLLFMDHFGQFDLAHLRLFSTTFVANRSRAAQDNVQVTVAILESLDRDALRRITLYENEFQVNNIVAATMLIKVIIRQSIFDTNATTRTIRERLSSLDNQMKIQGYDISKFNEYVKSQMFLLRARGAQTSDLLPNLFKGYKACKDENIVKYVKEKEDKYDEGEDISSDNLMVLVGNKHKVMVENGTYNTPSKDQVQLLALQTEFKKLQAQVTKKPAAQKQGEHTASTATQKKAAAQKKAFVKPAWMLKKPNNDNLTKVKIVDGKDYWWCPKHEAYGRHKADACEGKGAKFTPKPHNKAVSLAKALAAIATNEE